MNTYFTSDLHFSHHNVIQYSNRPFKDVEEMNKKMISNWNSIVQPNDRVIVVGDVYLGGKKQDIRPILEKLNGTKILVRGNHDYSNAEMQTSGFDFSCDEMKIWIGKERVTISHYPYRVSSLRKKYLDFLHYINPKKFFKYKYYDRRPIDDGSFLIHGHTHSKNKINKRMIHVGVDAWNFKPVPLQKIADIIVSIKENRKLDKLLK